jgi:TetR/AcrR family transcriptional regulator
MDPVKTSIRSRSAAGRRTSARSQTRRVRRLPAAARRDQLIEAATRLFSERGFGGTTTREIAQAAGMNEALIFRHFPHKEDLYAAILEEKAREAGTEGWVADLRAAAETGDDLDVLRRLMSLIMRHGRQDPQFLRLMLHAALDHREMMREFRTRHLAPLYQELLRYVEAGQRAGRFRSENPHALARVLMAVPSYHAMLDGLLGGDTLGELGDDAAEIYARMLLAALVTPAVGSETCRASSSRKRLNRD